MARRFLKERRYDAAEGGLGMLALGLGIWLIWPQGEDPTLELRERWQQSLIEREATSERAATTAERVALNLGGATAGQNDQEGAPALVSLARASMVVTARDSLAGGAGAASVSLVDRRLAMISETMPEIGLPTVAFPAVEAEFTADLPELAVDTAEEDGYGSGLSLAAASPLRIAPRRVAGHEWLRHAAAEPIEDGRPKIAIVIDDLGNNRANTAALNHLPGPLTLAFLPYAEALPAQTMAARAAGHELLIHMPMEPVSDDWPGPEALLTSMGRADFQARLHKHLESFQGFVGINNHMGSRLTADRASMDVVMRELRRRDLLFLDSKTTHASTGTQAARGAGVPFAQRDVFLDNIPTPEAVAAQLRAVEGVARRKGFAIAIGHPHPITIDALRRWLPGIENRGFSLVPVSTIVALRTCEREPLLAGCREQVDPVRAHAEDPTPTEG